MSTELLLKWVKDVLHKRKRKLKDEKKGLLILDGVSFHQDQKVREEFSFHNSFC
jgi:uridine kinase